MSNGKKQDKRKLLIRNMLLDVQGKSDTPAILRRKVQNIGPLRNKKWVEEIQL